MKDNRSIVGSGKQREINDFYPTPEFATLSLLRQESFVGDIWEPACGDGAMSSPIERFGYNVISSDIVDRGFRRAEYPVDFLHCFDKKVPNVITNPPYKLAQDFIEHSLDNVITEKAAFLLKLVFLESESRKSLFERRQLETVYIFRKRIAFGRNGEKYHSGGMIAYAWYVWNKNYYGDPVIKWI